MTALARYLDVHHHALPPEYVKEIGSAAIGALAGRPGAPPWTAASSVEVMDQLGIETAITSISAPGIPLNDPKAVQRLARMCNRFQKQMTVDHPGRFGMFATLPLPDIQASLGETEYAFEALSADGVVLLTNYNDAYLGDAHFAPLFEELNRRRAVVFVHPTVCRCSFGVQPGIPTAILEFPHDTTRTILSMMFHGTFRKYPDIRFIFSHAGGTIPFLVNRIGILPMPDSDPEGPFHFLERQYFDLALSANPPVIGALLGMVDVSHVLLGTDYPFAPPAIVRGAVEGIAAAPLDAGSIRMIQSENAIQLFPRFARK
jgi:predicted TIM-barrel fold metal-dependent hydrolase